MMLFIFSEILLFVPLCQFDNLLAYFFQFTGFFGKFVEKRKRFLLPVNGMDGLYTLVVVVPDASELLIESGELGLSLIHIWALRPISSWLLLLLKRTSSENTLPL